MNWIKIWQISILLISADRSSSVDKYSGRIDLNISIFVKNNISDASCQLPIAYSFYYRSVIRQHAGTLRWYENRLANDKIIMQYIHK